MSEAQSVDYEAMNQKQALAYASNILRTLASELPDLTGNPFLLAARRLDTYGKDMEG